MNDTQSVFKDTKSNELDLLRVVGHELKTPLTHIALLSRLLKAGEFTAEELPEQLARLEMNSSHMLKLIDSMLLAGQIETQQVSLVLEPINVASITHSVVSKLQPLAARHNRDLHVVQKGSLAPAALNREAFEAALYGVLDTVVRTSHSEVVDVVMSQRGDSVLLTIRDDAEKTSKHATQKALQSIGKRSQLMKQLPGSAGLSLYVAQIVSTAQAGSFTMQHQKNKRVLSFNMVRSNQLQLAL